MIISITVIIALLIWYALAGRKWLKTQAWANNFFAWIEPIEIALYRKSETLLFGRLLSFGGLLVTAYDTLAVGFSSLDLTPVTSRVLASVPEDMRGLIVTALFTAIGLLIAWLRKRTTKPIEVVAIADKDAELPGVKEAIAMADATKVEAVAAVEQVTQDKAA